MCRHEWLKFQRLCALLPGTCRFFCGVRPSLSLTRSWQPSARPFGSLMTPSPGWHSVSNDARTTWPVTCLDPLRTVPRVSEYPAGNAVTWLNPAACWQAGRAWMRTMRAPRQRCQCPTSQSRCFASRCDMPCDLLLVALTPVIVWTPSLLPLQPLHAFKARWPCAGCGRPDCAQGGHPIQGAGGKRQLHSFRQAPLATA